MTSTEGQAGAGLKNWESCTISLEDVLVAPIRCLMRF